MVVSPKWGILLHTKAHVQGCGKQQKVMVQICATTFFLPMQVNASASGDAPKGSDSGSANGLSDDLGEDTSTLCASVFLSDRGVNTPFGKCFEIY